MKVNDLVKYTEGENEYNALVLGERKIADHEGKDGEPLLTLVFAKERKDSFGNPLPLHGTGQQNELLQIRADVAHASHAYDEDQQKKYGRKAYDGGRWKDFPLFTARKDFPLFTAPAAASSKESE